MVLIDDRLLMPEIKGDPSSGQQHRDVQKSQQHDHCVPILFVKSSEYDSKTEWHVREPLVIPRDIEKAAEYGDRDSLRALAYGSKMSELPREKLKSDEDWIIFGGEFLEQFPLARKD
jgi:hypothetical protein